MTAENMKLFVIMAKGAESFNITDDLEKIRCPVLLLGSADDRVLGAYAAEQACDTTPNYKERMMPFLTKGLQTD